MVSGNQSVESNFHLHLTEHLMSEVVLRTINDITVAMEWLASTFLYVRAKKHPKHYGLPYGLTTDQLDKRLMEMCQIEINKLSKAGMLTIDETTSITPTHFGYLMAKYYLAFETMKLFTQINGTEILPQMLNLISKCQEFSDLYLRVNDKRALNLLNKCKNKETIRFPLCGRIKTLSMKINCLIQAVFGNLELLEHSLQNDAQKIVRSGERISKCLLDYLESPDFIQSHPKSYSALLAANILAKCFHARLWENSRHVAKQLAGIGITSSSQLVAAGKSSFEAILEANPRDLERILGKKPPFGNNIQNVVARLPKYLLQVSHNENKGEKKGFAVKFSITLENAAEIAENCTVNKNDYMVLIVGDSFNNIYIYEKFSHDYMVQNGEIHNAFETYNPEKYEVNIHFISQTWVGIDCSEKLIFNDKQEASNKTNKQTKIKQKASSVNKKAAEENKNNEPKKPPMPIQQFLDAYMKAKKPISKSGSQEINTKNKSTDSSAIIDSCPERAGVESDFGVNGNNTKDKSTEIGKTVEDDERDVEFSKEIVEESINEDEEGDKMVFDIMDEKYDDVAEMGGNPFETLDKNINDTASYNILQERNNREEPDNSDLTNNFELMPKSDDEKSKRDSNKNHKPNVSQPDSTCSNEIGSKTLNKVHGKTENIFLRYETEEQHTKSKRSGENNQRNITWRSPLVTSSPAVNYSPARSVYEINTNFEGGSSKVQEHVIRQEKPQIPDFSIKQLANSYGAAIPSFTPPARKNHSLKFRLADREPAQSQQNEYSDQIRAKLHAVRPKPPTENFPFSESVKKLTQPNAQNYYYDTIERIETKSTVRPKANSPASDRSDFSASTASNSFFKSEVAESSAEGVFKRSESETKQYRLKNFMSQMVRDERPVRKSLGKWRNVLDVMESCDPKPSCSKWDEFTPKEDDNRSFFEADFGSPPAKRKTPEAFFESDSPPPDEENALPKLSLEKDALDFMVRPDLDKPQPSVYVEETPHFSSYPRHVPPADYSPPSVREPRYCGFTEGPFMEFPASPKFRQPHFIPERRVARCHVPHTYRPTCDRYPQQWEGYPHHQCFTQPAMHSFQPPRYADPRPGGTHCRCCNGAGYCDVKRELYIVNPYLHCEADDVDEYGPY